MLYSHAHWWIHQVNISFWKTRLRIIAHYIEPRLPLGLSWFFVVVVVSWLFFFFSGGRALKSKMKNKTWSFWFIVSHHALFVLLPKNYESGWFGLYTSGKNILVKIRLEWKSNFYCRRFGLNNLFQDSLLSQWAKCKLILKES